MFKLEVLVTLKKDVLDPQGKAIEIAAKNINLKIYTQLNKISILKS